jgi:RNA polymerase sigma factor (sigma-70 family)
MTDQQILQGLEQNDRGAIAYVYKTMAPPIFKYVLNNNGSREDGKDLFQDAFVRVLKNVHDGKYTNMGKFEAYFIQIAKNIWIDRLRKEKQMRVVGEDDTLLQLADDNDEEAILQLVAHDQRLEKLMQAWNAWNGTDCHRRLNAFHFEKHSTQQIATAEQVPLGTLLKRLHDCRKKLFKLVLHS